MVKDLQYLSCTFQYINDEYDYNQFELKYYLSIKNQTTSFIGNKYIKYYITEHDCR